MTTENHDLEQPSKGESDWHIPLNENAGALDTLVEIRDIDANRGNYTPKDGAKYLAVDTGDVYLGDGSAWNRLGGVSDTEVADPDVFDARDYGGDVGGDQIRAALADAAAADAATIVVQGDGPDDVSGYANATRPRGWLLQSALEVPSKTTLLFRGAHVFLDDGVDQNLVRNTAASVDDASRNTDVHVRGDGASFLNGNGSGQNRPLWPDGNAEEPGALEHFGIFLHKVDRASVSGFQLGRTAGWALVAQDFSTVSFTDVTLRQDGSVYNQDGVSFLGPGTDGRAAGIRGAVGDDLATAYAEASWLNPSVGSFGDLNRIGFHDLAASQSTEWGGGIRLQTGGGNTVSDVTISDVRAEGGKVQLRSVNDPNDYSDLRNVTVSNVVADPAGGGVHFEGRSENISVSNFVATGMTDTFIYPNIRDASPVPVSVRNLTVENCHVESEAELFGAWDNCDVLENITLRDIHHRTLDGGNGNARILFYTTSVARNVTLENIRLSGAAEGGEGIYTRDEQHLENFTARNLTFEDVTDAVAIWSTSVTPPVRFDGVETNDISGSKFNVAPTGVVTEGVGTESANAQHPSEENWSTGDVVAFTDTGNGDGTGLYLLLPDGNWSRIGAT